MRICPACGRYFESRSWRCPGCGCEPAEKGGFPILSPGAGGEETPFNEESFALLAAVEEKNFWFRSRNALIAWALRKFFSGAEKFFEIGCGTGYVLSGVEKAFPNLDLYGSELVCSGLSFASSRLRKAELFQMDARKVPFLEEFDVIGAFDVLEHVREDEEVLRQMFRAAKKGGGILLTVPQHPFLWSRADEHGGHFRRYRLSGLRKKVEAAGFRVFFQTSFVTIPFPLMLLSRLMKKKNAGDYDPMEELRTGGMLNVLLEKSLGMERTLIRCGLRLPYGGSILLAARKDAGSSS